MNEVLTSRCRVYGNYYRLVGRAAQHPSNALVLFQLCQSEGLVLLRYYPKPLHWTTMIPCFVGRDAIYIFGCKTRYSHSMHGMPSISLTPLP
jgi:hypothetical protein